MPTPVNSAVQCEAMTSGVPLLLEVSRVISQWPDMDILVISGVQTHFLRPHLAALTSKYKGTLSASGQSQPVASVLSETLTAVVCDDSR